MSCGKFRLFVKENFYIAGLKSIIELGITVPSCGKGCWEKNPTLKFVCLLATEYLCWLAKPPEYNIFPLWWDKREIWF